ncbi:hypothetical protein NBT05_11660 [Aquimarina sp. ERC-38]|uniref:hypothetical protein n=1 Tax=Aquimarina sp. ERC-38 TaxID=2949996 RepID=UPI002246337E|nr:hypothetical protein [Aquimarina sp. ERC-38]UZO79609.1 hypothetical protein NBT05_11660 [Aquimarina sp. ERC-38]
MLFILFTLLTITAQEKSNYYIGIEGISTTKGVFANPIVGRNFSKLNVQVGLLAGSSFVNNKSTFGVKGDILLFPDEQREEEFNFHFISSFTYFKNSVSVENARTQTGTFQITFGYGFEYQIVKHLLIKSTIGLGALLERRDFNFNTNSPKNKWGFAGLLSLGINYKL